MTDTEKWLMGKWHKTISLWGIFSRKLDAEGDTWCDGVSNEFSVIKSFAWSSAIKAIN